MRQTPQACGRQRCDAIGRGNATAGAAGSKATRDRLTLRGVSGWHKRGQRSRRGGDWVPQLQYDTVAGGERKTNGIQLQRVCQMSMDFGCCPAPCVEPIVLLSPFSCGLRMPRTAGGFTSAFLGERCVLGDGTPDVTRPGRSPEADAVVPAKPGPDAGPTGVARSLAVESSWLEVCLSPEHDAETSICGGG